VDGIFSIYPSFAKAELIILEAQSSKGNTIHHKDFNKTAIMCKDSIDAVLRNYAINVPVHAIYQSATQFKCYCLVREYTSTYTYVKICEFELPKSLKNVKALQELLNIGAYMLAVKHRAKDSMHKILNVKPKGFLSHSIPLIPNTPSTPVKETEKKEPKKETPSARIGTRNEGKYKRKSVSTVEQTFSARSDSKTQGDNSIVEFAIDNLTNQPVATKQILEDDVAEIELEITSRLQGQCERKKKILFTFIICNKNSCIPFIVV